jgi:hypothetical protein
MVLATYKLSQLSQLRALPGFFVMVRVQVLRFHQGHLKKQ